MDRTIYSICIFVVLLINGAASQRIYKVCAGPSLNQDCNAIQRGGSSSVSCEIVNSSVDCALKIGNGTADFGVFTAEEVVLLSQIQPDVYNVLGSIKHTDRKTENFAFQSVAVVRKSFSGGLNGLRGGNFCHPGFGIGEQLWSYRVLKYFEQKVVYSGRQCVPSSNTPAETDALALTAFFKSACRPGIWTLDSALDAQLKSNFSTLCALCGQSDGSCKYNTVVSSPAGSSEHLQALDCLTKSGTVAYVAWQHVKDFFQARPDFTDYGLLCTDGTVQPFDNQSVISGDSPCSWIRQPWGALLASKAVSSDLSTSLKSWLPNGRATDTSSWTIYLNPILFKEPTSVIDFPPTDSVTVPDYVKNGRPIPSKDENKACHQILRWCTVSAAETTKCTWIQYALLTLGVEPQISCVQMDSAINCLKSISESKTDFISIDSNYGYLARRAYNLQNVLYHETQNAFRSKVIALVKESATANITRFENLRDKNACFPEYGGIAWVAFLRAAHQREVISARECDTAIAISEFFGGVCAPGAIDEKHSPSKVANITKLCSVCRSAVNASVTTTSINEIGVVVSTPEVQKSQTDACTADYSNLYFGTKGTLACIAAPHTDVAFIEDQYLASHAQSLGLNPSNFRVLCVNNSLALNPGFNVDAGCLLSDTVDSEIITRKNNTDYAALRALLHELDEHFGYTVASARLIGLEVFSQFGGVEDLLFKESTIGLANSDSQNEAVRNYVELFKHTDECSGAIANVFKSSSAAKFTLLTASILSYVLAFYVV